EGTADRDHPVAHFRLAGIAQAGEGQRLLGIDFNQREIGLGVLADHFGGELALVHQGDLNLVCVTRHVIVGQDIPVGRNDDARADPVFLEVMRDLTEKVPELFERIAPAGATATTERITRSKWTAAPATAASGTRTWLVLPAAGAIFVPLAGSTGFD